MAQRPGGLPPRDVRRRSSNPATYLVAVDDVIGNYAGLVRVWVRPDGPRLGLIGVLPPYQGRGLARALVGAVLGVLRERGQPRAVCEVDEINVASNTLITGFGARGIGGNVELVLPSAKLGHAGHHQDHLRITRRARVVRQAIAW